MHSVFAFGFDLWFIICAHVANPHIVMPYNIAENTRFHASSWHFFRKVKKMTFQQQSFINRPPQQSALRLCCIEQYAVKGNIITWELTTHKPFQLNNNVLNALLIRYTTLKNTIYQFVMRYTFYSWLTLSLFIPSISIFNVLTLNVQWVFTK